MCSHLVNSSLDIVRRNRALGRDSSVPLEGTAKGKEGVGPEVCDLCGYPLGLLSYLPVSAKS